MEEYIKQAIDWLSALDPGSEYGATNKEIILSRLEQDERIINNALAKIDHYKIQLKKAQSNRDIEATDYYEEAIDIIKRILS